MYEIIFEFDFDTLSKSYGLEEQDSLSQTYGIEQDPFKEVHEDLIYTKAYTDIKNVLQGYGFSQQHGSAVFFGDNTVNSVKCVLAVQEVTKQFSWFPASIKDIRMLRIEEDCDLLPVVEAEKKSSAGNMSEKDVIRKIKEIKKFFSELESNNSDFNITENKSLEKEIADNCTLILGMGMGKSADSEKK